MVSRSVAQRARLSLDARLRSLGPAGRYAVPPRGWIRAIRDSFGMSGEDLGRRMGVSGPAVFALERSEQRGTVRLETLRRAAEALDCTLVYAFIPKHGLEETLEREARRVAGQQLAQVAGTMALEDQAVRVDDSMVEAQARRLIESGRLWGEQP